jgi:plastocyanin
VGGIDNMITERNKKLILLSLVLAIIIIVSGYLAGTFLNKGDEGIDITKLPKDKAVSSASVEITSRGFMPATLTVKKGTVVIFTNKDKKDHRPASDPHPSHNALPGFDSQTKMQKGQAYSFFFDREGEWTYHDHLNPLKFKGTIIVKK